MNIGIIGYGIVGKATEQTFIKDHKLTIFSLDRKANNTVYNLGTDKAITIKQLSMLIADAAKSLGMLSLDYDLEFKTTKVHKHDVKKRVPDTNKLFIDFGWEPTINTADSINNYLSNSGFKGV